VRESVVPLACDGNGSPLTDAPTGILFQESTVESLIEAVRDFQENKHRFEPARIRHHASLFSRDRFKAQIRDYIDTRIADGWKKE
jgi:hypothetical protein